MQLRFDSRQVPGTGGFEHWRAFVHDVFAGLDTAGSRQDSGGGTEFRARLELDLAPGVRVARIGGSAHVVRRRRSACTSDEVGVLLQAGGASRLELNGRPLRLPTGGIALFDNARPYVFELEAGFEHHLLLIDRTRLGVDRTAIEARCGHLLDPDGVETRLIAQALSTLVTRPSGGTRAATLDALALPMVSWLGQACARRPGTGRRERTSLDALLRRAMTDAVARLDDPTLSPACLARAQGISERWLHRAFAARGFTVMGWIREERLQRVDRALRAARAAGLEPAIERTAREHGFEDPSSFRRAYRTRFGHSASTIPRLAGSDPDPDLIASRSAARSSRAAPP